MIPPEPAPWESAREGTPLGRDTVEIWRRPVDLCAQANEGAGLRPDEQMRAERMNDAARRAQYVAGHALRNRLCARHGAPLFTSLSHSGAWVIAAAARVGNVGVDVESLRADRPLDRLSRRFFAPEEQAWLEGFPESERVALFYGLWTAKEALFKALGMPTDAVHFAARSVFTSGSDAGIPDELFVEGHRVGWFSAAPGYLGAYAVPALVACTRFLVSE